jgi:hypothetical protein
MKGASDKGQFPGSMKDILSQMERNGINISGFEAEAEDIWRTLDDLSQNDPAAYQSFIQNQAVEHNANSDQEKEEKFFRPIVGFSVSTYTTGGDGMKIRDHSDSKKCGKVLYVNMCR